MIKIRAFFVVLLSSLAFLGFASSWRANLMAAERSITVYGEAKKLIAPDEVTINFAIETRSSDVKQAQSENNTTARRIVTLLKDLKIPERDTQTSYVQLLPQLQHQFGDRQPPNEPKVHYVARKEMRVILRQLAQYEELMTKLIEAGVNQIQSVEFASSKAERQKGEVRLEALREAAAKASDMAQALGAKLGDVLTIHEGIASTMPRGPSLKTFEARAFDDGPTIAPGVITIAAQVTVQFDLR